MFDGQVNHLRRIFLLSAVGLLALVAATWWLKSPSEPVYQGKALSQWLLQSQGINAPTNPGASVDEARSAIREIGSNGVPILLRLVRAHDGSVKTNLLGQLSRIKFLRIHFTTAAELNDRGRMGFRILGGRAANAVPDLIALAEHGPPDMALNAVYCLSCIGPRARAAGPAFARAAASRDPAMREEALYSLGCVQADPEIAIPALTTALRDPNGNIRRRALEALGLLGTNGQAAVPAILELLSKTLSATDESQLAISNYLNYVTNALQRIDPSAYARFIATNAGSSSAP